MFEQPLISLIFAGRDRIILIRPELPLTSFASPAKLSPSIEIPKGSPLCVLGQLLALSSNLVELLILKVVLLFIL
jgi:hypothetical protein